ncbi:MAG: type II toxin-antitoxin system HicB family antitoxin [Chloroflexota bacterium]|nr:type II toxin-antitoxin system HicB family antitoxin [Chloroflexota bacterium]
MTLRSILKQTGLTAEEVRDLLTGAVEMPVMARYTVVLTPDLESGGYTVTVPSLPGCLTDGQTVEDALERASEAIALYVRGEDEASLTAATNRAEVIVASVDVAVLA